MRGAEREPRRAGGSRGSALWAAFGLAALIALMLVAISALVESNLRHEAAAEDGARARNVAQGALHHASAEVAVGLDPTGNGLGALGVRDPVVIRDAAGHPIGEYRSIVKQVDERQIVLALAGVPSLAAPRRMWAFEANLSLNPIRRIVGGRTAAVSMHGAGADPVLSFAGDVRIDGNDEDNGVFIPAISASTAAGLDAVVAAVCAEIAGGGCLASDFTGTPVNTFVDAGGEPVQLPFAEQTDMLLEAAAMTELRLDARAGALALVAAADRVIAGNLTADANWGSAGQREVTVVDGNVHSGGFSVQGAGTLIVRGALRLEPGSQFKWRGDVIILADAAVSPDAAFVFAGKVGNLHGNVLVLGGGGASATFQLLDDPTATGSPSFTVQPGAILALADDAAEGATIAVDGSLLEMHGLVAAAGSAVNVRTSGDGKLHLRGTLGLSTPADAEEASLTLSLEGAQSFISLNAEKFETALEGLLRVSDALTGGGVGPDDGRDSLHAVLERPAALAAAEMQGYFDTYGLDADYGFETSVVRIVTAP